MKFYPLRISDVVRETEEAVSIELEIPEKLKETFAYQAGQYLTFRIILDGEEVRRSYSLCSAPSSGKWRVAVKHVPGGKFSTYANHSLKPGDEIEVMPPNGQFTLPTTGDNFVAFAAGSGITPILGMVTEFLETNKRGSFTLFYGNRNVNGIIFKETLEGLKNRFVDRLRIFHVLSRQRTDAAMFAGRINSDKCQAYFQKLIRAEDVDGVFLCGPEEMTFELKEFLPSIGIPEDRIKFELFTTPGVKKVKRELSPEDAEKMCTVKLKLDAHLHTLNIRFNSNVLDGAIDQGIDLPYSCKGGVCSTCKAKLIEGEVDMEVNYALEEEEVEAGFILTCQSYPKSAEISVDFDA